MKKLFTIFIWSADNRFERVPYLENGKLKEFRDYQSAWVYIFQNNLPLGASAVELTIGE